ncbi:uncharacterized protein LOC129584446 [Paramacrobiotus metropolitanus]|uniref:uncharacterized protein LOC129584446 n=1 Tax=Paramacrobiotus metropolitanus TaxID=2943436 RepID=UPI0024462307|nr:uncharacterized protein LOC129584446 [Paramacrobiotus metropolitanus]
MIKLITAVAVLVVQFDFAFSAGTVYPTYNLGEYCGGTITVPCPYFAGEGGTLRFISRPNATCSVQLQLEESCGSCANSNNNPGYGFYLNFRNASKYELDAIHLRSSLTGTLV